mmetsp:Transcript_16928/g.22375  ORF Transcript_16928/g.22375 Transcript_16928/m.22375 type:complete len:210 (+) Transcript_16928:328-957(+)
MCKFSSWFLDSKNLFQVAQRKLILWKVFNLDNAIGKLASSKGHSSSLGHGLGRVLDVALPHRRRGVSAPRSWDHNLLDLPILSTLITNVFKNILVFIVISQFFLANHIQKHQDFGGGNGGGQGSLGSSLCGLDRGWGCQPWSSTLHVAPCHRLRQLFLHCQANILRSHKSSNSWIFLKCCLALVCCHLHCKSFIPKSHSIQTFTSSHSD